MAFMQHLIPKSVPNDVYTFISHIIYLIYSSKLYFIKSRVYKIIFINYVNDINNNNK